MCFEQELTGIVLYIRNILPLISGCDALTSGVIVAQLTRSMLEARENAFSITPLCHKCDRVAALSVRIVLIKFNYRVQIYNILHRSVS